MKNNLHILHITNIGHFSWINVLKLPGRPHVVGSIRCGHEYSGQLQRQESCLPFGYLPKKISNNVLCKFKFTFHSQPLQSMSFWYPIHTNFRYSVSCVKTAHLMLSIDIQTPLFDFGMHFYFVLDNFKVWAFK